MREIKVRLIKDNGGQVFYELSSPIRLGRDIFGNIDLEECLTEEYSKVSDAYKESFRRECSMLCVSDAHTHNERLVFVGHNRGDEYYRSHTVVCGSMTKMIDGGDRRKMYDIDVYLRFLGRLNGAKFTLSK